MLHCLAQMLNALDYLHKAKVLHRDLKTSNIFISKVSRLKLGDFGISKVLENSIQNAQTVVGTPYYMSPEICQSKPYSFKSDIWSLGCILFELCALRRAFESSNLLSLVTEITEKEVREIPEIYSRELNRLIQRMLRKDPAERASVEEIRASPPVRAILGKPLGDVRILSKLERETSFASFSNNDLNSKMDLRNALTRNSPALTSGLRRATPQKENVAVVFSGKRLESSSSIQLIRNQTQSGERLNGAESPKNSDCQLGETFQTEVFPAKKPLSTFQQSTMNQDSDLEE